MLKGESMKLNNVLVTGAAGDIGLGMAKILTEIDWISHVFGMDLHNQLPTKLYYTDFFIAPSVHKEQYLEFLKEIVKNNKIDLIIPSSEPELRFFVKNSISEIDQTPILLPTSEVMNIGFDKMKTAQFLKDNGFDYPWTVNANGNFPKEIPCIKKMTTGSGSKSVEVITSEMDESNLIDNDEWIYQELLLPDDQEYTCGVYRSVNESVHSIVFKRTLSGGRTGYAEVIKNQVIEDFITQLSEKIGFIGSVNFQLRLTDRGPILFEINPRFSSTLVFRHKLGFKDLEWAILDKFNQLEPINYDDRLIIGKKIFRSDSEIIY